MKVLVYVIYICIIVCLLAGGIGKLLSLTFVKISNERVIG